MLSILIFMKNFLLFFFALLIASQSNLRAQQKAWTLGDCISYAINNNIQIKQQVVQTQYQKNTLDLAKFRVLPTVNGSASHNYSFGRALDQTTYQYTNHQTVQSNNFYMGVNLNLFNGLQTLNTVKKNEYLV
jgi:outer membrane protein